MTLEYGPDHDKVDPFDVTRAAGPRRTTRTRPTTPRICTLSSASTATARSLAEHHLAENLENHWDGEASHRAPLVAFFEKVATL